MPTPSTPFTRFQTTLSAVLERIKPTPEELSSILISNRIFEVAECNESGA